jgi:hypothetical protein
METSGFQGSRLFFPAISPLRKGLYVLQGLLFELGDDPRNL